MEKKHVKGNTYYINIAGTATGIYYLNEKEILMIDSGGAWSAELFRFLRRENLTVKAVIHTHIHEDHVANSDDLKEKYGAVLYARKADIECEDTYLESHMTANKGTVTFYDKSFRTILTPGHTEGHQMIITPDDVCFLGDTLITDKVLAITKLPYQLDTLEYIKSLEIVRNTKASAYVASHLGEVSETDIERLIKINKEKQTEIYDSILVYIQQGKSVKQTAYDYLIAAGVKENTIRRHLWIPEMIKDRIYELALLGKIKVKNGKII